MPLLRCRLRFLEPQSLFIEFKLHLERVLDRVRSAPAVPFAFIDLVFNRTTPRAYGLDDLFSLHRWNDHVNGTLQDKERALDPICMVHRATVLIHIQYLFWRPPNELETVL
jgi:hypothetical protein